jgi:peptidoglycan/xylan/chitin deacetylase (PgdA/CDA1 family)
MSLLDFRGIFYNTLALMILLPNFALAKLAKAQDGDVDAVWKGQLNQLEQIELLSDAYLQDFDKTLEQKYKSISNNVAEEALNRNRGDLPMLDNPSASMMGDPAYARLISARILGDEIRAKMEDYYAKQTYEQKIQLRRNRDLRKRLFQRNSKFVNGNSGRNREIDDELVKKIEVQALELEFQFKRQETQVNASLELNTDHFMIMPDAGKTGLVSGYGFPKGMWALTYDDGPTSQFTKKILKNLTDAGIRSTFFWLANQIPKYLEIVAEAEQLGMNLGNHSFSHVDLSRANQSTLVSEIIKASLIDQKAYGFKPKLFRCPYGACLSSPNVRQMIADDGMINVFWNVDSLDWHDKNPESVYQRIKRQMAVVGRGIILVHDTHPQTVVATKRIIQDLSREQKLGACRVVTVQEAIDQLNQNN